MTQRHEPKVFLSGTESLMNSMMSLSKGRRQPYESRVQSENRDGVFNKKQEGRDERDERDGKDGRDGRLDL